MLSTPSRLFPSCRCGLKVAKVRFSIFGACNGPLKTPDYTAAASHKSAATAVTFVQRRTHGSQSRHLCYFSGISRNSRRHKMPIQRLLGCSPPVISAEIMQLLPILQHKWHLAFELIDSLPRLRGRARVGVIAT